MTCAQFEQQVHEITLAPVGESSLDEALGHAESCASCARLLAGARALREGLRALAADRSEQAPPPLEAMLLAAFRRRRRSEAALAGRRRWALAAVGSGAIAALFAVTVTVREWRGATGHGRGHAPETIASSHQPSAINYQPNPGSASPSHSVGEASSSWRTSGAAAPKPRAVPLHPKPQGPNRYPGKMPAAQNVSVVEWATDFLPLPYAGDTGSPEPGELVRVELPRSALTELGLPLNDEPNGEAAGETISAEVFIGEDGLARAIRFVQSR